MESSDSIQQNIGMLESFLPTMQDDDVNKGHYVQMLRGLYQERDERVQPFQPLYAQYTPSYETQSPPSPPPALSSHSRKRSLGPSDYPEAKRVSGQPSPVTPTTPVASWSQSLPRRQSNHVHPSDPIDVVDLTESSPPSPQHPVHVPVQAQHYSDPFAELQNAFQGYDNSPLAPFDTFNQDYMDLEELADFILSPTAPGAVNGYQQQPPGFPYRQAPGFDHFSSPYASHYVRRGGEGDDYGGFPMNAAEADAIEKLFENIKEDGETAEEREPTPAIMTCTLKEYQRIGLTWLLKMERGTTKGGILADEMGLGKTIQALSLLCANPSDDPACKTTLIIAPVALMRQWEKEIERHVHPRHKLSVYLYHGSGKNVDFARLREYDVVLTTFGCLTSEFKQKESRKESMLYEQESHNPHMQRKAKDKLALLGPECMWYRIIIDEAHNIKNRNAKSSKACADLMARHRLCMTGTPMMNSIDELYPLVRFLKVEPYCEWTKFSVEIARPVKNTNPSSRTKAMNRIRILLRSLMLRRQKDSKVDGQPVSNIPPKHTMVDNVDFDDEEHELYNALQTKSQLQMNKYIEKNTVSANYASVLVLLLRLRQACCHPHLIKDLSQPATEGIAEDDLMARAEELNVDVIVRIKNNDSFECPICLEADPNPTIIIPCGHTVCGECVQKIIDPAMRAAQQDGNDETSTPKCPHCRGELKARLITDYKHFCKVHCPERLGSADLEDEVADEDANSDSDSDSNSADHDEDAADIDKSGNLAGFVVDDDEDKFQADEADNDDVDSASEAKTKSKKSKTKKSNKGKGKGKSKGKGKGKARADPKMTLAQLKKESLRNKSAKKRYLRRLDKTYVPSAKISRTVELLQEFRHNDPTEKTLVFSQFTSLLDLVEVPLHREKIRYQRYDGSMKMDERADAVSAFMDDPQMNVMLVSLKAGNAGLNLWKASQVIILDPFWNPFIEEQAVDRAHRMPQTREVHVHRILVPETVEDRITHLQDQKREMIGSALDEKESKSLTRLNVQELKYLFGMN
ncbi:swi snf family dna-dependent atpase [Stemphylium lycopersici]|uniref:Swi snf family dna-dependent atpase n=1 Tax=Stemphylium lycopersici TaxID=183478 RepID=A0A364N5I4_STELY|nr:swi snf family dna-dependent atpase [Stemphylium lycopersici]